MSFCCEYIAYQSGLVPRCSLLLDLHVCAGRSESKLAKHTTSTVSPVAQFLSNTQEAKVQKCR
jgi:hypothetical protein